MSDTADDEHPADGETLPDAALPLATAAEGRRKAQAVLELIESVGSASVPVERAEHCRAALASLARARALLQSALLLDMAGRADVVGLVNRALLEVWYFGVIALLGDEADLDRFEQDHRYWNNDLNRSIPGAPVEVGPDKKFSVLERAKRADKLLTSIGEPQGPAIGWYKQIYASESLTTAHAGIESLLPYALDLADGSLAIDFEPTISEGLRHGRLVMAAALVATLGRWTWERVGLDGTAFDDLDL